MTLARRWRALTQALAPSSTSAVASQSRKRHGDAAEDLALAFLQRQGLRLKARNVRYRFGEIDLVMLDAATLVFVEVRSRSTDSHGGALQSIGAAKQRRIIAAAAAYLQTLGPAQPACRFDVVILQGQAAPQWIRAAFSA
jgi:putative endonuclease